MSRPPYAQRLNRDVAELFTHNFNCSASSLTVIQMSDSLQTNGSLVLQICIYEGPYRGGCYLFGLNISESYPFRPVEVFAAQPIWHPNIDLYTGKVALPMEWSPVLTLNSLALAVQMLLIEPSAENPLNMDAYSYYISQSDTFEQLVQKSIAGGCTISGVKFASVRLPPAQQQDAAPGEASLFGALGRSGLVGASPQSGVRMSGVASTDTSSHSSSLTTVSGLPRAPTPYSFAQHMSAIDALSDSVSNSVTMEGCSPLNISRAGSLSSNLAGMMDSAQQNVPPARNIVAAPSEGMRRKRQFEHTESSMELETLCRQQEFGAGGYNNNSNDDSTRFGARAPTNIVPNLVRQSSLEEWNQRISMACSQLSLSVPVSANVPVVGAGPATGVAGSALQTVLSPQGVLRGASVLPPPPLQVPQSPFSPARGVSLYPTAAADKLGAEGGMDRTGSYGSMEVCSPYKKVKFVVGDS